MLFPILGRVTPEESNPMYLISLTDELFPFLPKSFRKWYRFGYSYDKTPVGSCTLNILLNDQLYVRIVRILTKLYRRYFFGVKQL